jgi:hypothetical protein
LRRRFTNPAFSKTIKCFDTAASDIACGRARSVTHSPPFANCDKSRRRVGSANAPKVRSNDLELYSTIRLNMKSNKTERK